MVLTAANTGSQTEIGESPNPVDASSVVITFLGRNVTANFTVLTIAGNLVVVENEDEIVIIAASDIKVFDGTPLVNPNYTYNALLLPEGVTHITAVVAGSQTEVGISANVITSFILWNGETDVTANFPNVTLINGTLEVTPIVEPPYIPEDPDDPIVPEPPVITPEPDEPEEPALVPEENQMVPNDVEEEEGDEGDEEEDDEDDLVEISDNETPLVDIDFEDEVEDEEEIEEIEDNEAPLVVFEFDEEEEIEDNETPQTSFDFEEEDEEKENPQTGGGLGFLGFGALMAFAGGLFSKFRKKD